jgi:intracellular sulfur oxidation DsrE/DsrF family protein
MSEAVADAAKESIRALRDQLKAVQSVNRKRHQLARLTDGHPVVPAGVLDLIREPGLFQTTP